MSLSNNSNVTKVLLKFNLQKSTAYLLQKQFFKQNKDTMKNKNIFQDIFGISKDEIEEIIIFSNPPKKLLTIKRIQSHLKSKFGSNLNRWVIIKYLKNFFNYSFKKG